MNTELNTLINSFWDELYIQSIGFVIHDVSDNTKYDLTTLQSKVTYNIILDELNKTSPLNAGDCYYCTTVQEIKDIIEYIKQNPELYLTDYSQDALNNDTLSIDKLIENGYIL